MTKPIYLQVALPVPLPNTFDYLAPEGPGANTVGRRVLAPFGRKKLVGVVVGTSGRSDVPPDRILEISRFLDADEPLLDPHLVDLLKWCWRYYKHAPGEVTASALPPALRKADGHLPAPILGYSLTAEGLELIRSGQGRAPVQAKMLQAMEQGAVDEAQLRGIGSRWRKTLATLLEKGWVQTQPAAAVVPQPAEGPRLNEEQQAAVQGILEDLQSFHCHLLDGVTGSGKTEVYMRLLEQVLDSGRQALVLVPEIGLTPQLLRRFSQRLGFDPAVIHSGLGAAERLRAWSDARSGRAPLLVGTRSALFTPMPRLGLIILDEEHDASFKQQDGFRYSARDIAVKRAAELDVPVLLGSATPSLETLSNAVSGKYRWHKLRKRANRAELPVWRVLDLRQQATFNGLSASALEAAAETLDRGEQVMVFLNRRGYAPVLMCQQCGWHASCDRCDANLTWHRSDGRLCCHHCGSQRQAPGLCPDCRADALMGAGEGTQQLEESLGRRFPDHPVLRFDRDRVGRKGVMDRQIEQVRQGEPCLLVGTQMLAKGHHFPGVTLVIIVNIDQALYSSDFRALERMGQMIQQVAGRAGRMDRAGTVILQTLHPDHPALELLLSEGYESYARWLLEERLQTGLPPAGYQALLRAEAHDRTLVEKFLEEAAAVFPRGKTRIYGPVPAIMERVGGRSRMYLVLQGADRGALHRQIDPWLPRLRGMASSRRVRWAMDIDPQEL